MRALITCLCFAGSIAASSITVTVWCNGQATPNLPISVVDSASRTVPEVSKTDQKGMFVIQNSQTFTAPFSLRFKTKRGSNCRAAVQIAQDPTKANVQLFYYPTNLPCSCANLKSE